MSTTFGPYENLLHSPTLFLEAWCRQEVNRQYGVGPLPHCCNTKTKLEITKFDKVIKLTSIWKELVYISI